MFQIFSVIIETIKDPPLRRSSRSSVRNSEDPPCVIQLHQPDRRPALERCGWQSRHFARRAVRKYRAPGLTVLPLTDQTATPARPTGSLVRQGRSRRRQRRDEHGGACVHPMLGKPMRAAIGGGKAVISSNVKVAAAGTSLDVPLGHKDDSWSFPHFDTITVSAFSHTPEISRMRNGHFAAVRILDHLGWHRSYSLSSR
jgi:Amino acid synthesis